MNAPHPLSHLIQSIEDGQGWTDRELSRRIDDAGHTMSHSYIGKLKNHPIQSVTAAMVRALAAGLGVSETVVAIAALESMGVHIDTSREAELDVAISTEDSLTDYDKRLLRAVVKEMRTNVEQHGRNDQARNNGRPRVPRHALPDGATTGPENTAKRPLPEDVYGLAASRGPRGRAESDKRAGEAGEESQDPEG